MISPDDVASFVVEHSRAVVAVLLVASVAVGAGAPMVEQSTSTEAFQPDTVESAALDRVEAQYSGESNRSVAQVIVRDENVLDRESLLAALAYERAVLDNDTVERTLVESDPVIGVPNLVATAAIR